MPVTSELAAARGVDALRSEIWRGEHRPGSRLDEASLATRLGLSRNSLREAFRLLAHERLVVHEPHRGVFVRVVDADATRQIFEVRRHLECGALQEATVRLTEARSALRDATDPHALAKAQAVLGAWQSTLDAAEDAVAAAEDAAGAQAWGEVGTHNVEFHLAIVRLADNDTFTRIMSILMTEVRLRFLHVGDERSVHEPWIAENRRILALLRAGDGARAAWALEAYLVRAGGVFGADTRAVGPREDADRTQRGDDA